MEWAHKYKANCPVCRSQFEHIFPLEWVGDLQLVSSDEPLELSINSVKWSIEEDEFYTEEDGANDFCMVCNRNNNFNVMLVCDECNTEVCHVFFIFIITLDLL